MSRHVASVLFAILLAFATNPAGAQWQASFENGPATWKAGGADTTYEIADHRRVPNAGPDGSECETIRFVASNGTYLYLGHDVPPAMVIEDLRLSLSVRSDRPGLTPMARVVLPRSRHPRTGRPITLLVPGSAYQSRDQWQTVVIADLPAKVAQQVRAVRAELLAAIDDREAYVDQIVLNAYGGPGVTSLWLDNLRVDGLVGRSEVLAGVTQPPGNPNAGGPVPSLTNPSSTRRLPMVPVTGTPQSPGVPSSAAPVTSVYGSAIAGAEARAGTPATTTLEPRQRVALNGSVLTVDGSAFFPRVIEYRGEPLPFLAQLGFNTIWVRQPPTPPLLEEARQTGIWILCPPPAEIAQPPEPISPASAFGEQSADKKQPTIDGTFDQVLAWWLGSGLHQADVKTRMVELARRVRAADPIARRPLVVAPLSGLDDFSRHADVLWIDRRPIGTDMELRDFDTWLRGRGQLARPGTPIWATVQTQPSPAVLTQLFTWAPTVPLSTTLSVEQMRLLTLSAIGVGSRAIVFQSGSPLTADDPDTRRRAAALELLNIELRLIEPWAAAGTVASGSETEIRVLSGGTSLDAAVLRVEHARLVMPMLTEPAAQYAIGHASGHGMSIVVPGLPKSASVFELTPGRLRLLTSFRVTGGTQIDLEEFDLAAQLIVSEQPLVIDTLARRASLAARRAAELESQLAHARIAATERVVAQLAAQRLAVTQTNELLTLARGLVVQSDRMLAEHRYPQARQLSRQAMRGIRLLERAQWEAAVGKMASPMTSPAATSFAMLPAHGTLVSRINSYALGPSRLAGGTFEDVGAIVQGGWRHGISLTPAVQASADLLPGAAKSGTHGLRLSAKPTTPDTPPEVVEMPPVWITTAPLQVQRGEVVRIAGFVRVPREIDGSVDGLMIVDSLGGEDLAYRIGKTDGWRQFVLYRAAARDGPLTVSFVLTGLGEAWLDDITIRPLNPPTTTAMRPGP